MVFAVRGNYFDPVECWLFGCRTISFIPDFFSFPAAANFSGRSASYQALLVTSIKTMV
jgi:hypothetical protein